MKTFYFLVGEELLGPAFTASSCRLAYLRWSESVENVAPGMLWKLFEGQLLTVHCRESGTSVRLTLSTWSKISRTTYPSERWNPKPMLNAVRDYKEQWKIPCTQTVAGIA